ncbi:uncharacterized protein LOC132644468 [Lycium barbarum]|uniref:uncharacterized protein LOC132644468 n=1 Tax=Lycium barbarum TaxID=112863 RepID=UPI00293EF24F|nr:uncharacterized protein LOC132644468 [Lycium barbarum]
MVEVPLNQKYPECVMFENEKGCITEQEIYYEWKPILCEHCKIYGHGKQNCRKLEERTISNKEEKTNVDQRQGMGNNNHPAVPKDKEKGKAKEVGAIVHKGTHQAAQQSYKPKEIAGTSNSFASLGGTFGAKDQEMTHKFETRQQLSMPSREARAVEGNDMNTKKGRQRKISLDKGRVYGFNDQGLRRELWQQIEGIHDKVSGAWAVMGDFNCVLNREERVGRPVTLAEVREFKQCVGKCSLHDLKSSGAFYTWNNKHRDATRVYSKIDRVLVNPQWITNLPASEVHFGNEGLMDHCPTIISWDNGQHHGGNKFRYYNMWGLADNFKEIVQKDWERNISGTCMFKLVGKLNILKATLRALHRDRFSNVEQNAGKTRMALDVCQSELQNDPTNVNLMVAERRLAEEYQSWKMARGQYLQQKCKGLWNFFRTSKLLKAWNNTVITLLPKFEHAENVRDYRLIACCNTSYKIISKMLSNRLRQVLPSIISPNQSAFVSGRTVVQNVLICQDLVRLYNRKNSPSSCLIKINLKKAYDTVEWAFVKEMMHALNFPYQFIRWTMACITTPQFTIAINGGLYGCINGRRGLRQGDPISPLIFVICMEYFTRIMKVVAHQVGFEFHPKCRSLQLNHYASRTMSYCSAKLVDQVDVQGMWKMARSTKGRRGREVALTVLAALVNWIWKARNRRLWDLKLSSPDMWMHQLE